MQSIKEKKERALGIKLFLKAERCNSPKCVMIRRPYRPGVHGQKRKVLSEYGRQLQEKQKIQITYGLTNTQLSRLFKKYDKEKIRLMLEQRLDRTVFNLGFVSSIRIAKQLVSHGHILVNNRKVTIPSYYVKIGNIIAVRGKSRDLSLFEDIPIKSKQFVSPAWFKVDKNELKGECITLPDAESMAFPFDIDLVGEFYSR